MAVARSLSQASTDAAPVKKVVKRAKVLATDMGIEKPAAKKCVAKPAADKTKKPAKKKPTATTVASRPASEPLPDNLPAASHDTTTECHETHDPRAPRRSAVERLDDPLPASGPLLIARVANAIERELTQIEIIVGNNRVMPRERSQAERRARTLASLARTLAIVTQLRAKNLQGLADDADDDAMPRDLDEFRETLAQRLEQLLADEPQLADGEPDAG